MSRTKHGKPTGCPGTEADIAGRCGRGGPVGRLSAVMVEDLLDLVFGREPVDVHAHEHLTMLQPAGEPLKVRVAVGRAGKSPDKRADHRSRT